jgi:hypothetical protein
MAALYPVDSPSRSPGLVLSASRVDVGYACKSDAHQPLVIEFPIFPDSAGFDLFLIESP